MLNPVLAYIEQLGRGRADDVGAMTLDGETAFHATTDNAGEHKPLESGRSIDPFRKRPQCCADHPERPSRGVTPAAEYRNQIWARAREREGFDMRPTSPVRLCILRIAQSAGAEVGDSGSGELEEIEKIARFAGGRRRQVRNAGVQHC